jgi:predicted GH43/DUF377 family glycosyl hydrolase
MDMKMGQDVIRRCDANPLITPEDMSFRLSDILNCGVTQIDGEYVLLITVQTLQGTTALYVARSANGQHFTVEDKPLMTYARDGEQAIYESFGIRDARITRYDDTFYITYVADGDHGLRLALARTSDFREVERMGCLTEVDSKNGALFPRKIGDRYALLSRPDPGESIWVSYSDDLTFWGSMTVVMTPRSGYWDPDRIGAAGPPIEIDPGWLLIYYGEKYTSAGPLVRLGAAILDRDDPSKVISRSNIPILSPRERYERIGDIPNVVFSCGAVLCADDIVRIYYGGSDSCICMGEAPLEDIVRVCIESGREF